jgi:PAS domain S-box-containing protein
MSVEPVAAASAATAWQAAAPHEHFAQLYEDESVLLDAVNGYVREGLDSGAAAIVIATTAHLDGLKRQLRDKGAFDCDGALERQQLILVDAQQMLERLLCGTRMPQRDAFMRHIAPLIAQARERFGRAIAFGEMVSLLWKEGNLDAAILLEDHWNELARAQPFTLFCGYQLQDCSALAHIAPFDAVCERHHRVIPTESERFYSQDPLRVIARLQQRASALEQEMQVGREAEERLAQLAAIVADSDDAIVSKSLEGIIRSWNAGAERIFGYTAQEAIGRSITLIIPPQHLDEEREIIAKIRAGERVDHFETTRMTKSGRLLPISLTVSPVRNGRGEIIGASKIARDISERKRIEHSLVESQQQLLAEAAALTKLNDWSSRLWQCRNLEHGFQQMIDGVIELLGADMGAVQLLRGDALVYAAQRGFQADFLERFRSVTTQDGVASGRALKSGQRVIIEDVEADPQFAPYRALARAAGFRAVVATPLLTAQGALLGVLSTHFRAPHRPSEHELRRKDLYARQASDFLQRCRTEEALRASDERRAFLLELNDELRLPSDPLAMQALAARMLGERIGASRAHYIEFDGDEFVIAHEYVADGISSMVGRHSFRDFGGNLVERIGIGKMAVIADIQSHRSLTQREKDNFAAAGSAALAGVILTQDGRPAAAFAVHNATPRQWTNADLELIAEVGERVWTAADRARATAALRESEKRLRAADQKKDEFLATLAHELRNPLAPIRNALYLLRLSGANSSPERLYEILDRQVAHVVRLVDDLLEVSRITRGKIELRREPIALGQVVRIAVETSRPIVDRGGHRLSVQLADEPLTVNGDLVRLSQVFANILNNAAKYTDAGGRIELVAGREGDEAVVRIRDNGIGIAPEQVERLFEMFAQVERDTQRSQGGLGIGLWLVKQLVDLHGGSVAVESAGLGRGSCFVVRLRLETRASSERPLHVAPRTLPSRCRMLVVDDNPDAADSLGMLLSELGREVRVTHGAAAALQTIESWQPDVVLLDICMPGADGYEVAQRIRERLRDVVLVAVSGHPLDEDRKRDETAGFRHRLCKPVDLGALQAMLLSFDAVRSVAAETS